jgi:hypothetical protein
MIALAGSARAVQSISQLTFGKSIMKDRAAETFKMLLEQPVLKVIDEYNY